MSGQRRWAGLTPEAAQRATSATVEALRAAPGAVASTVAPSQGSPGAALIAALRAAAKGDDSVVAPATFSERYGEELERYNAEASPDFLSRMAAADPLSPEFAEAAGEAALQIGAPIRAPGPQSAQIRALRSVSGAAPQPQDLASMHPRQAWDAIAAGADASSLSDDALLGLLDWNERGNGEWGRFRELPMLKEELRGLLEESKHLGALSDTPTVDDLLDLAYDPDESEALRKLAQRAEVLQGRIIGAEDMGAPTRAELLEAIEREREGMTPVDPAPPSNVTRLVPKPHK